MCVPLISVSPLTPTASMGLHIGYEPPSSANHEPLGLVAHKSSDDSVPAARIASTSSQPLEITKDWVCRESNESLDKI